MEVVQSLLQTVEISISGVNNDKQNDKKTRQTPIAHSSFLQNYIVGDRKDEVCDDDRLDSKNIDIRQFERNPHLETTIRARFNPKHVDERARIVQETASEIFRPFAAGCKSAGGAGWGQTPGKASGGSATGKWAP